MKVTNWRRSLAATLAAVGLISPAAYAADLNVNLVVNPSFETVMDPADPAVGNFGAAAITAGWANFDEELMVPVTLGAYNYTTSNYSTGTIPPNAGNYFLSTPATGFAAIQRVDLSTGATAAAIAAGTADFSASAYFSNYTNPGAFEGDWGVYTISFEDSSGAPVGEPVFIEASEHVDPVTGGLDWVQEGTTADIPVGAALAVLNLIGDSNFPDTTNGTEGYFDLIEFRVIQGAASLQADFNGDKTADGHDFLVWQRGLGAAGTGTKATGDANGDGNINAADLAIWKADFGKTTPAIPVGAAVPEPSSVIIVGVGLLSLGAARRRVTA